MIYNLKLNLFILITLVDFAELLTDFSYTNFTVGLLFIYLLYGLYTR